MNIGGESRRFTGIRPEETLDSSRGGCQDSGRGNEKARLIGPGFKERGRRKDLGSRSGHHRLFVVVRGRWFIYNLVNFNGSSVRAANRMGMRFRNHGSLVWGHQRCVKGARNEMSPADWAGLISERGRREEERFSYHRLCGCDSI